MKIHNKWAKRVEETQITFGPKQSKGEIDKSPLKYPIEANTPRGHDLGPRGKPHEATRLRSGHGGHGRTPGGFAPAQPALAVPSTHRQGGSMVH
jgi:hypothetical protein